MQPRSWRACGAVAVLALLLAGCAPPLQQVQSFVASRGWQSELVSGEGFRHRVFRNGARGGEVLHVYIEGDGTPYANRLVPAADPTPRRPLMLHLMALDPAPSVYIGRPCYFDTVRDANCSARYWTLARFSPEVLRSMVSVIESERRRSGASRIELHAHSGGAALAVLSAARLPAVTRLVTVGGNLDIDAWTRWHRYTRLQPAENPAAVRFDRSAISVLHLVGADDRVVPAPLVENAAREMGGEVRVVPGFTHQCCWERLWPSVLEGHSAGETQKMR